MIANSGLTTKTASQIVAGVTLNTAGTYSVTVENTASSAQSTALSFTVGVSPVPSVSYISPTAMTANSASNPNATQPLYIYGSNFALGNVVQFYWTKGNNAYYWNTSNSTPTITPTLITIPMNPGLVADTINVRVCESASQATASTCSSGTQAVTVTATTLTPSIPTGLAPGGSSQPGQTVTTLTPTLTWNVSTGATSYSVAVSTASGAAVFSQNVTINSLQIPSGHLTSGTTYVWALTANNSAGSSAMSAPVFFTVNVPTAPATPTGLAPGGSSQPGQTVTTLTPTLTWNVSTGATSYSVAVLTASNAAVFSQNVTTNSLQIPSGHLTSGTTYVWALTANNSVGSSSMSAPVYFTVVAAAPSISYIYPTTMTASTTALTTLYVYGANFSTSGGQLEFLDPNNIQYSSNAHQERVVTVIPTEWVYNLNNGGTTGTWHVRVVNADSQASSWVPFAVQ
jgi:hypothetical protein